MQIYFHYPWISIFFVTFFLEKYGDGGTLIVELD